jgi:hypothetical protein
VNARQKRIEKTIWRVIHRFCEEHPNVCADDIFNALADVVGDQLASIGSHPLRESFLKTFNDRMQTRIKAVRENAQ